MKKCQDVVQTWLGNMSSIGYLGGTDAACAVWKYVVI